MDAVFKVEEGVFNYRVAGVLIENDHILLHKQVNDTHWALPGGRVQILEDSATAVKREIHEELGLSVQVQNLLWVTENFFTYNHNQYHEIGFYYQLLSQPEAMKDQESFFGLEGERLLYQWVPLHDLEQIELHPTFLKTALQKIPASPEHIVIKNQE
ncbi:ADP-ribose pyrophosphatase YjhB, NUDIX family [Mesobacillus persicus]|uniref:ADP-ribose pyrophosphatase YjhB, NUDIX family n=1 Tax=Mesobacillus persicus TaxID=930146 RepID=A0A1H7WF03_9BACI|nr:NUDIX hydrolase [Mesobacillus persicus]SEM20146.1 ADP-ribose pyrophosphatase YjhB, NUDIX family [Mesobacillus persicus]